MGDIIRRMLSHLFHLVFRLYFQTALLFNAIAEEMNLVSEPLEDSVRVASGDHLASLGVYHKLHRLVNILSICAL